MKAQVTLHYRGPLAQRTGREKEQAPAASVDDALRFIKLRYGADAYRQAKRMLITVDGESILMRQRFKTSLSGGETVTFLPVCAGG